MISISKASKIYNQANQEKFLAIDDISLNIKKGEFVVLLGSNGSGKSTLLNAIAGRIKLTSGAISIYDKDVSNKQDFERSSYISYIYQNPILGTASNLTILENFRLAELRNSSILFNLGTNLKFKQRVQERISELNLGLENKLFYPMSSLSGGQRQALTILMATMANTKILLMDEPTAALDTKSAEKVMEIANKVILDTNITAILITHQLKDSVKFGNRLLFLKYGTILKDIRGNAKNNLTIPEISSWF